MPETESLLAFLARVRRRHTTTELVRHSLTALIFGLGGLILLLLAGTQIFDWYWPVLLFTAALGVGAWQFRRHIPTQYRLAQIVDSRLDTHDSLSTALHFLPVGGPMITAQRAQAGRLAGTLSAETAVPMVWPKTTYAVGALLLASFTLLGIRYGILNTLDLSAPVSEAVVDVFRFSPLSGKKQMAKQDINKINEELQKLGLTIDENAKDELTKIEMAKEGEITTSDIPDVNDLSDTARGEKGKASVEGKGTNPGEGDSGEGTQESQNADPNDPGKQGKSEDGKQQNAKNAKQGTKSGDNNLQANNNSMLDKMKDAFANMLNKLKSPNPQDGQQQAANQKGGEKGGQQKGGQSPGKQPGKGNEAQNGAEQASDEAADASEKQANAQGQGGDKSASMQAPPDAKSGVGKADGDKSIKDAEQLQAMGKISEILGKRAKDIAGEVMVEVNGGKQQLRTQYANSNAKHAESGGEIHRDEVPLHHQQYVQQYFEEVRKQSNAQSKKPSSDKQ
ncbi:MAG: hypothetical protein HYX27_05835 [Acidobacteria bacterium]|nr:hypothetical protein [Acidobacteriota bacterium]